MPASCSPAEAKVFVEDEVTLLAYRYEQWGPWVDPELAPGALCELGAASNPAHLGLLAPSRHAPTPTHCIHSGQNTIIPANAYVIKLLIYIYTHIGLFFISIFIFLQFLSSKSTPR